MISTSHITQHDSMADFFSMDCTSRGDLFAFFRDHDALKIPIIDFLAQSGGWDDPWTPVPTLYHHLVLDYF